MSKGTKLFPNYQGIRQLFLEKSGKIIGQKLAYVEKNDYLCGGKQEDRWAASSSSSSSSSHSES